MNKDEIIELLKEQNSHYKSLADSLLVQVKELTEEIASLKEALLRKDESLGKQQRIAKGLSKLVANKSERQGVQSTPPADEEARKQLEEQRAIQRKARKNNGASGIRTMNWRCWNMTYTLTTLTSTWTRPAC